MGSIKYFSMMLFVAVLLIGCTPQNEVKDMNGNTLKVSSPAFKTNGMIPRKYTCQGDNINPPLEIDGVPDEAKSLVLVIDDPDAPMGTWDHWVVWNIPPTVHKIDENSTPNGAVEGTGSAGKTGYGGPCPPSGTHRYFFKVYALDTTLDLPASAHKKDVENAIKDHILGEGQLVGNYQQEFA